MRDGAADGVEEDEPQIVAVHETEAGASGHAERLNAQHGHEPFLARIPRETGDGTDEYLVTADHLPTTAGRWAVVLVIEAQAA